MPELWSGATVVCIGGGPSLTEAQVRYVERAGVRIIAIQDAYRLCPSADALYFCDDKWWQWHHEKLRDWKGMIVRLHAPGHDFGDKRIKVLRNLGRNGLQPREVRDGLSHGQNSGYQAIGLAVLLGATRILLIGYDMHAPLVNGKPKTHWFGDHPVKTAPSVFDVVRQNFDGLVKPLAARGVTVLNCTPGSQLQAFPRSSLEKALPLPELTPA